MKWLIFEDAYVRFELEKVKEELFIHCTVHRMAYRHIDAVFDGIKALLWLGGARRLWAYAKKDNTARFAKLYGFKFIKNWREGQLLKIELFPPQSLKE